MTVSDKWNQASNLIAQQTHILVTELSTQDDVNRKLKHECEKLQRELDDVVKRANALPYGVTRVSLENKIHALESENRHLAGKVSGYRGYMKLKDASKIKVEQQRDAYKAEVSRLRIAGSTSAEVEELKAQNTRLAEEWQERQKAVEDRNATIRHLTQRAQRAESAVTSLQEVLQLGREGLEAQIQKAQENWGRLR